VPPPPQGGVDLQFLVPLARYKTTELVIILHRFVCLYVGKIAYVRSFVKVLAVLGLVPRNSQLDNYWSDLI